MKKLLLILAISGAPLWGMGILVDISNSDAIVKALEGHGGVDLRTEIELKLRLKNVFDSNGGAEAYFGIILADYNDSFGWKLLNAVGVARSKQATQLNYIWGSTDGVYDILISIRERLIGKSVFANSLAIALRGSAPLLNEFKDTLNNLPLGRTSSWFASDLKQLTDHQTKIQELAGKFSALKDPIYGQVARFLDIYSNAITQLSRLVCNMTASNGLPTRLSYWGIRAAVPLGVGAAAACAYKYREGLGEAAVAAGKATGGAVKRLVTPSGAAEAAKVVGGAVAQ